MSIAIAVKHLLSAGVTGDALVTAIAEMEAAIRPVDTRSKGAIRQARYRENKASQSVTNRNETSHSDAKVSPSSLPSSPSSSSPPIPPLITTPPSSHPSSPSKRRAPPAAQQDLIEILSAVIPTEFAKAFVEHRAEIKKPMTVRGAQMLAKDLDGNPDAIAAVKRAIAGGHQGFYPKNSRDGPSGLSRARGSAASLFFSEEEIENDRRQNQIESYSENHLLIPFDGGN